jgi:hypothetical protein
MPHAVKELNVAVGADTATHLFDETPKLCD